MYPVSLASANLAMGWLLYRLSEPFLGGLVVVVGVFVLLASVGRTVRQVHPALRRLT
jgi:hypothetical protein